MKCKNYFSIGLISATCLAPAWVSGQTGLQVTEATDAAAIEAWVSEYLNLEPEGLTFSGDLDQIATFEAGASGLGISSGMLLATGSCENVIGPNDSGGSTMGGGNFGVGDSDLALLSSFNVNDAAILEFDFVATSDVLSIELIFGSDEYNEYVCGSVNDVIGVFLSGPGIEGPFSNAAVNIATIPNTEVPISINTVNLGIAGASGTTANCEQVSPNWAEQSEYFVDNTVDPDSLATQLDGYTVPIPIGHSLVVGEAYHLKFAIADAGDTAFDSAVFLRQFNSDGCTYANASNYNPAAIADDGSCTFPGCTDAMATNFSPIANIDDGSCIESEGNCVMDGNLDGAVDISDLLILLGEFGQCGE